MWLWVQISPASDLPTRANTELAVQPLAVGRALRGPRGLLLSWSPVGGSHDPPEESSRTPRPTARGIDSELSVGGSEMICTVSPIVVLCYLGVPLQLVLASCVLVGTWAEGSEQEIERTSLSRSWGEVCCSSIAP